MWLNRAKNLRRIGFLRKHEKPPWLILSLFSYSDSPEKKEKVAPLQETRMRDRFTLYAKGGDGGGGCSSVRRSRTDRRGRPDGGNGGRGGDVILECTNAIWDFSGLQPHVKAGKGGQGASKNKIGTRGEDKIVRVPVGTVIHLVNGELPSMVETNSSKDLDPWELPGTLVGDPSECDQISAAEKPTIMEKPKSDLTACGASKEILAKTMSSRNAKEDDGTERVLYNVAELTDERQRIIVACGGEGGLGSVCATNIFRHPKSNSDESDDEHMNSRSGSVGSESVLILELKSIADVGLVGMPNVGKSTLLGALSRAKPRVGHYAFTTLRPNLGNVNFDDFSITVADIPGLIKGAHQNRGLGHNFLRHIERTKVLAYVVDLASGLDGRKGISPWQQLKDLILELEHHEEGLSDRPCLVVANKIDEGGADKALEELKRRVQGVEIYPVCAVLEEGVAELKHGLRMLVNNGEVSQRLRLEKINVD